MCEGTCDLESFGHDFHFDMYMNYTSFQISRKDYGLMQRLDCDHNFFREIVKKKHVIDEFFNNLVKAT